MKADTWMALYVGAYLADTMHLARQHHGSYLLLIMAAFKNAGWLPNDDDMLAQVAKCTPKEWKAERALYAAFFQVTDERWTHKRVTAEWEKALALTDERSKAGASGAAKRWQGHSKGNGKRMAEPSGSHRQNDGPSQSQSQPPVTTSRHVEAESDAQARDASALAAWQASAGQHGWPEVQFLNSTRRYQLRARLGECGGLEGWNAALTAAAAAEFLKNQRWFDFDWMLKPENFTRLMEGRYAERHRSEPKSGLFAALAGLVD